MSSGKNSGFSLAREVFLQVSAMPLALFRICFGGVLFYEFGRLLWSPVGRARYIEPIFHFKYPFFEWVVAGPEWFMYVVFVIGLASSIFISLGLLYRYAAITAFLTYTYLFLLEISYWNNHYYLYSLFTFVLVFVDANAALSLDNLLKKRKPHTIPRWHTRIFSFQIIVVYVFGAISKLVNPDWMSTLSVRTIIANSIARNELELSDQLTELIVQIQTYGGIGFDLFVGFLLIYRRTFLLGVLTSLVFHFSNHFFLTIGSFPFAMVGTLFLFIPERWVNDDNVLGADLNVRSRFPVALTKAFLISFTAYHLLMPLRHYFYEGLVFWTGEGKIGAWHMMSGSTAVDATYFYIYETDSLSGDTIEIHSLETADFLTTKQRRTLGKWPFLVPEFAKFLKQEAELVGMRGVKVSADIFVSRNGHRFKPIVPPDVDLATLPRRRFGHNSWVLLYAEEHF